MTRHHKQQPRSTHLEGLSPQSVRCLGKVLDEGAHEVFEPDQAVDISPPYLPPQERRLWLLKLLYDRPQMPLIELLQPLHLRTARGIYVQTPGKSC